MAFVVYDVSTGLSPVTLASLAHRNDFSREGGKTVTSKTLTERSERHGVQGGGACPAVAKRKRGHVFL
jgi:hypothetical protein